MRPLRFVLLLLLVVVGCRDSDPSAPVITVPFERDAAVWRGPSTVEEFFDAYEAAYRDGDTAMMSRLYARDFRFVEEGICAFHDVCPDTTWGYAEEMRCFRNLCDPHREPYAARERSVSSFVLSVEDDAGALRVSALLEFMCIIDDENGFATTMAATLTLREGPYGALQLVELRESLLLERTESCWSWFLCDYFF